MTRSVQALGASMSFFVLAIAMVFESHPVPKPQNQIPAANQQVTFNRDIAPILFRNCTGCHRPGEAGPFPLLTYKDAKSHARQIAAVTQTKFMPPSPPPPGEFKFADELQLTDQQIELIAKWAEGGA